MGNKFYWLPDWLLLIWAIGRCLNLYESQITQGFHQEKYQFGVLALCNNAMLKHFATLAISMNSVIRYEYYLNRRESSLADEYTANITIRKFILILFIYKKENSNISKIKISKHWLICEIANIIMAPYSWTYDEQEGV